jgi:hypothetical protein
VVNSLASAATSGGELLLIVIHHAAVDEHLGDVDLGAHLGQFEAGVLEVRDRPVEGLALSRG